MPRYHFDAVALRQLRQARHLRTEHLAIATGRTKEAVVLWEQGKAVPPTSVVLDLCDALDCTPEDLLTPAPSDLTERVS